MHLYLKALIANCNKSHLENVHPKVMLKVLPIVVHDCFLSSLTLLPVVSKIVGTWKSRISSELWLTIYYSFSFMLFRTFLFSSLIPPLRVRYFFFAFQSSLHMPFLARRLFPFCSSALSGSFPNVTLKSPTKIESTPMYGLLFK